MATPHSSASVLREATAALAEHGSLSLAAEALGIPRTTLQSRLRKAQETSHDGFPEDDLEAPELLSHMERRFNQRQKHADALRWFEIKVKDNLPLAINWFGDPHLGSNGCNVPLIRRDAAIVAKTKGMVGANIGDTADNWGDRMIRLYAENDVSKATERRLARWFLEESGIPWMLWLFGNHDQMDGGFATYLQSLGGKQVPMVDWRARFSLVFPNGRKVRIDAAHNHKGHSQWNELHGQERASVFDEQADLYIAGHHHVGAIKQKEMPDGRVVTLARARGYKWMDSYADVHGFHQKQGAASVVTIIDPEAKTPWGLITPFADTAQGADFLGYRRRKST